MEPKSMGDNLVFRETFHNHTTVKTNGGTVNGTPTIDDGVTLNGSTDYVLYALGGEEFNSAEITIMVEFYPDFEAGDTSGHVILDASSGGADDYLICVDTGGELRIDLGNTTDVMSILSEDYSAYWVTGGKNVLIITGTSGNNAAWLNGTDITDTSTQAWSPTKAVSQMWVGALDTEAWPFDGIIKDIQIFKGLWTDEEILDAYQGDTYSEIDASKSTFYLPLKSRFGEVQTTELLTDNDMETAGVAAWTATDATLTKETTNPHGGTQVLRVTATGVTNWASQVILTTGKRYKATGWARGDSVIAPMIYIGGGIYGWTDATTSTSWQYFDIEFTALATSIYYGSASDGGYTEWDDLTVVEMTEKTENLGTGSDVTVGDGYTTTTYPTFLTPHGFSVDGGDYLLSDAVNITGATGLTMFAVCSVATTANQAISDLETPGNTNIGGIITYNTDRYYFFAGGQTAGYAASFVSGIKGVDVIIGVTDGTTTDIYVNGVKGTTASAPVALVQAATQKFSVGARPDATLKMASGGKVYNAGMYNIAMTPRQVRFLTQKLLNELNV